MDESELMETASQLSSLQGGNGIEVGSNMNALNAFITRHAIETVSPQ